MGIAVGMGFRAFAYGLLWGACLLQDIQGLSPLFRNVLDGLFRVVALSLLTAILWVPFVAGFLSAYYWSRLESRDQLRAQWLSVLLFLLIPFTLWLTVNAAPVFSFSVLLVGPDVCMCGKGVNRGNRFWNSRQSRQFRGDFSADPWKDDSK